MAEQIWTDAHQISSIEYTCGYCSRAVASDRGWCIWDREAQAQGYAIIVICPNCNRPTYFEPPEEQTPGVAFGNPVSRIPEPAVRELYEEARRATAAECYTAAVLCCRKLLMHIAVEKGATAGSAFMYYVEHLLDNHYISPDAREWVDYIRKKGNEANHEIIVMKREDAEVLVAFVEMLLKVIYEFPATVKSRINT